MVNQPSLFRVISAANAIQEHDSSNLLSLASRNISQPDSPAKVWTGINVLLEQALVPNDRPVVVWADLITVKGTIQTGGQNLFLSARTIKFDQDARIDSMAPPPADDYPPDLIPRKPEKHGAEGVNGKSGSNGGDAGNVFIICEKIEGNVVVIANGQRGGNAQSGGAGQDGKPGVDAIGLCANGIAGTPGGHGGLAGTPGNGGNGGIIAIATQEDFDASRATLSAQKGEPGSVGKHGKPGIGGKAAKGGKGGTYSTGRSRRVPC